MGHVLILGAGNGGLAAIADLGSRGVPVALYNRGEAALAPIRRQGGVRYQGVLGEGFVPLETASTDLSALVPDADAIMACVPASAHTFLAGQLAAVLRDGQWIVLNPGRHAGRAGLRAGSAPGRLRRTGSHRRDRHPQLHLSDARARAGLDHQRRPRSALRGAAGARDVDVPGAPRRGRAQPDAGHARFVNGIDEHQRRPAPASHAAGPLPGSRRPPVISTITTIRPFRQSGVSWMRSTGSGWRSRPPGAWTRSRSLQLFARIGSTSREAAEAGDYRQALLDSTPNRYIKAPPNLEHRYMTEDMPFGLLPLAEVGRLASVPTPVLDAVVTIASVASGPHDFRGTGRTLDRLGLQGRSVAEVLRLIQEGE